VLEFSRDSVRLLKKERKEEEGEKNKKRKPFILASQFEKRKMLDR
jgi:hypothetical protein